MNSIELRTNFHTLIDNFQNENVLSKFYEILSKSNKSNDGKLWARLSILEQEELIQIMKSSEDEANLVSNDEMKSKYKKWL